MSAAHPGLPALSHPLVRAFLDSRADLEHAVTRFGAPLHLLFPQVYARNLARLRAVARSRAVAHRICYAHKVNRSTAFVRTAERAGIGIDVASPWELSHAERAGFDPTRIEVTGPKGEPFLRRLVGHGATINVDNLWELGRLIELAADGSRVPVLLRVADFPGAPASRFGIALAQADRAFSLLSEHHDRIDLRGFAFHLDSGELAERVRAVEACLDLVERAYGHGHAPSVLNIGGGFRQVFTADAGRFDGYVRALRASLLGRGQSMSWGANTFGYHVDGGAVHGVPVFHKYANTVSAADMLDGLLTAPLERHGGRTVAEVAGDNLLTLWLEPGKALVDHAGITVAAVMFTKELTDDTVLVTVDLSRDAVTPADQEVMVDPLLLPGPAAPPERAEPIGVYLAGRLCLERDMIANHKVWLPWRPRPGDLLVFPNTAAYHTDLSAASASMHPAPVKAAVTRDDDGFHIVADHELVPDDCILDEVGDGVEAR
ncbi:decarboxylase [Nocardia arizonensis]|uniref:decarboxylase n=1 Tax=Nocardia arizonensis TaxID=1141647 RepID=UPI0006D162E5|nr:decarboxylase [Nocardia arizonensis]